MTRRAGLLIAAAGLMLVTAAAAHPDLLAQIERLDGQIRAEPDRADLLIRRGDLYRRHEDFAAATRDFDAARALTPENPELDFHEGRLALEAGDPGAAAQLLDRYLDVRPRDPVAWRLRAETAVAGGEPSAAAFERAIRFSESPSPALYRQWALALLVAGDQAAALAAVDEGLGRFGAEVSLLGLGVDTALANLDAARATSYLGRLPAGLERMSPWEERRSAALCLRANDAGMPAGPPECAAGALRRLDAQVRAVPAAD